MRRARRSQIALQECMCNLCRIQKDSHTLVHAAHLTPGPEICWKSSMWAIPTILLSMTAPPNFRESCKSWAMKACCAACTRE